MRCATCDSEVRVGDKFCPSCGARLAGQSAGVNTGGGAYVGGGVQLEHGDFVGRDKTVHGDEVRTTYQGLQGEDLTRLFPSVYSQIQAHAAKDPDADADVLTGTAKKIEQEAQKGEQANPEQIKKWLSTLGKLAPDVLEVAVNALTNPGAAVASGVKLVARAFLASAADAKTTTTS